MFNHSLWSTIFLEFYVFLFFKKYTFLYAPRLLIIYVTQEYVNHVINIIKFNSFNKISKSLLFISLIYVLHLFLIILFLLDNFCDNIKYLLHVKYRNYILKK